MKNKLRFLVGVSLKRKIATKWFFIVQGLLFVLVIGLLNLDVIVDSFGGDFKKTTSIYVVDETEKVYDIFEEAFLLNEKTIYGEEESNYQITKISTVEEKKELVGKEGGIIVHILPSSDKVIEVELLSKETIDTYAYNLLNSSLNNAKVVIAMEELGLTTEDYTKIMSDVSITTSLVNEQEKTEEEGMEMVMSTVFPIFILPVFMLTLFLVQMVGAEVNDEKTTKAMEIIISNVSPKIHFFAKVIAGNLFVITQALLLLLYGGIGLFIRKLLRPAESILGEIGSILGSMMGSSISTKLLSSLPLIIVLMLLTFVAYALLAGVLASMTTTTEDYQQVQMPIIILSLLGYYLGTMAGMFKGSILIKICSFLPFISSILSPSLLVLGQIGMVELIISIGIMIITDYLLVKYGLRIYKVGILNYSSSGLWKKMAKALKK